VTLSDGRVYVFGGHDMQSDNGLYKVNIFDPDTETWVKRREPCTRANWHKDPFGRQLFARNPDAQFFEGCDPRDQQSTQPSDPSDQKYARWYPSRWFGFSGFKYSEFGVLASHLRWVDDTSRRLARAQFHMMIANGPALEKRQALLFRCVDIGAELYAITAVCVRAQRDLKVGVPENVRELADLFCRDARRRVEQLFRGIADHDDALSYDVAREVLDQRYDWLEQGIVDAPEAQPENRETQAAS